MLLSGTGIGRLRRCLVVLALSGLCASATAAEASACTTAVVRDYTGFIDHLPPLPEPAVEERLPFAPERVFFRGPGGRPLQAGAGPRRYSLSYSPYETASTQPSPTLDWQVTATLTPIDELGHPLAPPQTNEQHVDRLWPSGADGSNVVQVGFDLPADPAIYRLQLEIDNGSGEQLAIFGEYIRVLPPSVDVRLSLNRKTFKPGQHLRATLANYGVAWYGYGYPWSVEYKRGGSWRPSPVDFTPGAFILPLLSLKPGESTSCWSGEVPREAPAGRYRFVTGLSGAGLDGQPSRQRKLIRTGFTVLPRKSFATSTAVGRRTTRRAS
jgi:hypothetical protein